MADVLEEEDELKFWYLDVVEENGQSFDKVFRCAETFLERQERVCARSVHITGFEQDGFLYFENDIDGCVIELKTLKAIKMAVRHITVGPKNRSSMFRTKSVLKKHLDLTVYSKNQRLNFMRSVGSQLFYEGGWECYIALTPSLDEKFPEMSEDVIRWVSFDYFQNLKLELTKKLRECAEHRIACRTLMKNDLNDVGRLFILPDDSESILLAVQNSIDCIASPQGFKPLLFCFRFGEKMLQDLSLDGFNRDEVKSATVHVGIDISSVYDIDLFWSMSGIQSVIGERGVLSSCLSFNDCGNYQSNLDGRAMDVKPVLRGICSHPELLRFVQLYADVPHKNPKTRFHPVSGSIAGGLAFAKETADAFCKDAERYLSTLNSNWLLMSRSTCRLEFVVELHNVPERVRASDCVSADRLKRMLEERALIVPFPHSTITCVQRLGVWITKELEETFVKYKNSGNVNAIWRAYQLELAEEKLLWGRPLTFRSRQLSVNLGPGILQPSRSLTDHLGFLALEECTACMDSEDRIPPAVIWTTSAVMKRRIERTVGFHDVLDSSYGVIGRKLLYVLLQDLYEVGRVESVALMRFDDFLFELINDSGRLVKAGSITTERLLGILSSPRRTCYPMVFGNVAKILERSGLELKAVLKGGLSEMKLKCFPAVQIYDANRHATLNWSMNMKYWEVAGSLGEDNSEDTGALSSLVKGELERRRLVYVSKLKKAPVSLPWISVCLRKLSREKLSDDQTVTIMTFVSCLALIMQGWYVEYEQLQKLEQELPISQYRLRGLEIQSKQLMKNFNRFKLFRLHHTIPHQIEMKETARAEKPKEAPKQSTSNTESIPVDKVVEDAMMAEENAVFRPITCLPANALNLKARWSPKEMELLEEVSSTHASKTVKDLYDVFKRKCIEKNIPFRTFTAFKRKLEKQCHEKGSKY